MRSRASPARPIFFAIARTFGPRFNGRMPALTPRRYPERPDCWHIYYGDIQVATNAAA